MFNPNINIIDFLLDFIGYIILCVALTSLGDINEYISDALVSFKRMIFIDAGKILAFMWVFGISVTSEHNSSLMLWSFIFGVLALLFLVPAYSNLFKGFTELGYFHNNTAILGTKGKGKVNYTDKIKKFTFFFIILKSLLSFLPEFSDLTSTEYYENHGMTNLYQYVGVMRLLAFIPVFIVGLIWVVKITVYFNRLNKDAELCSELEKTYAQRVLPKNGIFIKRNIAIAFAVLITALVLSFDLRIENINILPDFISAILLFVFFVVLAKKTQINKTVGVVLSCIYFVVSAVAYYFELSFFGEYSYGAVYRDMDALRAYVLMALTVIAGAVVFAVICIFVLLALSRVVDAHTGYILSEKSSNAEMQNKMAAETQKEIKKYLLGCLIATVIYTASDICYILLAKDYGFMLLINWVCTAVFIVMFIKSYNEIYEAVSTKYMLE